MNSSLKTLSFLALTGITFNGVAMAQDDTEAPAATLILVCEAGDCASQVTWSSDPDGLEEQTTWPDEYGYETDRIDSELYFRVGDRTWTVTLEEGINRGVFDASTGELDWSGLFVVETTPKVETVDDEPGYVMISDSGPGVSMEMAAASSSLGREGLAQMAHMPATCEVKYYLALDDSDVPPAKKAALDACLARAISIAGSSDYVYVEVYATADKTPFGGVSENMSDILNGALSQARFSQATSAIKAHGVPDINIDHREEIETEVGERYVRVVVYPEPPVRTVDRGPCPELKDYYPAGIENTAFGRTWTPSVAGDFNDDGKYGSEDCRAADQAPIDAIPAPPPESECKWVETKYPASMMSTGVAGDINQDGTFDSDDCVVASAATVSIPEWSDIGGVSFTTLVGNYGGGVGINGWGAMILGSDTNWALRWNVGLLWISDYTSHQEDSPDPEGLNSFQNGPLTNSAGAGASLHLWVKPWLAFEPVGVQGSLLRFDTRLRPSQGTLTSAHAVDFYLVDPKGPRPGLAVRVWGGLGLQAGIVEGDQFIMVDGEKKQNGTFQAFTGQGGFEIGTRW